MILQTGEPFARHRRCYYGVFNEEQITSVCRKYSLNIWHVASKIYRTSFALRFNTLKVHAKSTYLRRLSTHWSANGVYRKIYSSYQEFHYTAKRPWILSAQGGPPVCNTWISKKGNADTWSNQNSRVRRSNHTDMGRKRHYNGIGMSSPVKIVLLSKILNCAAEKIRMPTLWTPSCSGVGNPISTA